MNGNVEHFVFMAYIFYFFNCIMYLSKKANLVEASFTSCYHWPISQSLVDLLYMKNKPKKWKRGTEKKLKS